MLKKLFTILFSMTCAFTNLHGANQEIEIKFQLKPEQETIFKNWKTTTQCCTKSHVIAQSDTYFDNPTQSFFAFSEKKGFIDALSALRVRNENDLVILCFKVSNIDPETKEILSKDEYESPIKDHEKIKMILKQAKIQTSPQEMTTEQEISDFLKSCGFTDSITIKKTREQFQYNEFEIVQDTVLYNEKPLGTFFEVELKDQTQDAKEGKARIKKFLKDVVGLTTIKEFSRSYIHMVKNPDIVFCKDITL